ncbi:8-oxo-dGTP diphosphatase [Salirhabdus euzebyi]|uniref:8-oxo-dGTP diphosphatase n=1 Tax=Salirhabdus euzebyi TaxID=394506 RepID=A0A841Q5A0_9BACI|nr:8-oxo-dGTP diphosphatase [Salirhabdus euzebyi]MBB6453581.1 8-oxo-dGTP diphosphatase [Salirhabdus euzebyi]
MQRVTNCILVVDQQILMLKKPRRNWYVAPGGKMEQGEHIKESVKREFKEETGLTLIDPKINGIFTFIIRDEEKVVQEWMLFTFYCENYEGKQLDFCREGELEWVSIEEAVLKPMAEGDRKIFEHAIKSDEILYGTFTYTSDYNLLAASLDPR